MTIMQDNAVAADTNEINELRARIATLESSLQDLNTQCNTLQQFKRNAILAVGIYSEELIVEANDRDWCDVYDNVASRISERVLRETGERSLMLTERERDFDIEVRVTATYNFERNVTVTASTRDQARRLISDDLDSYIDVSDAVRYESYDDIDIEFP